MKRTGISRLYNKCYDAISYATGASVGAGIGNGLGSIRDKLTNSQEIMSSSDSFGQGFVNNFPYALPVAMLYPITIDRLLKTNHPRLYANLFQSTVSVAVLAWHFLAGTENPIETLIPMAAVMFPMVNQRVSNHKNLEKNIED